MTAHKHNRLIIKTQSDNDMHWKNSDMHYILYFVRTKHVLSIWFNKNTVDNAHIKFNFVVLNNPLLPKSLLNYFCI